MIKVIFSCCENMNESEEEFEFEDDATEGEIEDEFKEWVWNEIGDRYCWYRKDREDDRE